MKPYRLINERELSQLQQQLKMAAEPWGVNYCMHPLEIALSKPLKASPNHEVCGIYDGQTLIAVTSLDLLSKINLLLFGIDLKEFNTCSKLLLEELLQMVFGTTSECYELQTVKAPSWHYQGSPSLSLILTEHIEFLLSPEFVYSQLPQRQSPKTAVTNINELLTHETIELIVDIDIPKLSLQDLLQLEVGDVLSTDQLVATPIPLKHKSTSIAEINLGQSNHFKSIQIKRFL